MLFRLLLLVIAVESMLIYRDVVDTFDGRRCPENQTTVASAFEKSSGIRCFSVAELFGHANYILVRHVTVISWRHYINKYYAWDGRWLEMSERFRSSHFTRTRSRKLEINPKVGGLFLLRGKRNLLVKCHGPYSPTPTSSSPTTKTFSSSHTTTKSSSTQTSTKSPWTTSSTKSSSTQTSTPRLFSSTQTSSQLPSTTQQSRQTTNTDLYYLSFLVLILPIALLFLKRKVIAEKFRTRQKRKFRPLNREVIYRNRHFLPSNEDFELDDR